MEDDEDERYAVSGYSGSTHQGYRKKLPVRNATFSRPSEGSYEDDEEDENSEEEEVMGEEAEGEEEEDGHVQGNGVHDADEDIDDHDDHLEFRFEEDEIKRHPKKRKLKSLISTYEFAPRISSAPTKLPSSGRNPLTDWNEKETMVLLEAWGDKFLDHGRKSLRSEEWASVADKVSKISKVERTDTQCRNRLDTLKKKYKKEKAKVGEMKKRSSWMFFSKMDMLMCGTPMEVAQLNRHGNSESCEESEGLPPKKRRSGRDSKEESSYRLLADSICKFSEIYEKTESIKRQQEMELEKMRMEMHKDLEAQRRKMIENMHAELAKDVHNEEDGESPKRKSG